MTLQRARVCVCISFFLFDYNLIYHTSAAWLLLLLNFCVRLDYAPVVHASGDGSVFSNGGYAIAVSRFVFFFFYECASHIYKPAIKHANRAYVIFCARKLYASCDLRLDKEQYSSSWARYSGELPLAILIVSWVVSAPLKRNTRRNAWIS